MDAPNNSRRLHQNIKGDAKNIPFYILVDVPDIA
jgi:hypothetical protein